MPVIWTCALVRKNTRIKNKEGKGIMKILTFAVPCYNSEAYMEKCIDSLLVGGEDVEILIDNDGS